MAIAKGPNILVVDDERSIRMMLEAGLTLNGFNVTTARNGREAIEAAKAIQFDGVVSDVYMPDGDGLDVVRELRSLSATLPILLITAQGSVELAVQAVQEGATDFLAKPFEVAAIAALLRRHLHARQESEQIEQPGSDSLAKDLSRSGIVGRSPAMVRVYKLIAQAARSDAPVLIMGESGTGKELVARAIHDFSSRKPRPFLAVNCSGLTDTLLEAELFGHTRGAYTGAAGDRAGLFEAADGGTLFLDELGSTSPAFQVSLLRVLQSGEVRRLGSTQAKRFNVRILGASNASLRNLAAEGAFRPDLFYRLSVLTNRPCPVARTRRGYRIDGHALSQFCRGGRPDTAANDAGGSRCPPPLSFPRECARIAKCNSECCRALLEPHCDSRLFAGGNSGPRCAEPNHQSLRSGTRVSCGPSYDGRITAAILTIHARSA